MRKSTKSRRRQKAAKPHRDFPLTPHPTGRWCKKIRGKLHYFGKLDDPDGALALWLAQKDDLLAGRTPRATSGDGLTLKEGMNRFLNAKAALVTTGELSSRTLYDYQVTCRKLGALLGYHRRVDDLVSEDFERLRAEYAKTRGAVALGDEVQRVRGLFKYLYEAGLIDKPIRYGPTFKRPSRKTLRKLRAAKGPRMFEAAELLRLIDAAGVQLRAMLWLGVNCGYGNHDCATLPLKAVDLERGWAVHPRPKTGIERRCPLWPETIDAIRQALAKRPRPRDEADAGLVFITKYGERWHKEKMDNPISKETIKVLKKLNLHRPGLGFYTLRHVFETIGGETRDQPAVDAIMGHARDDMASIYRERIGDDRLRAVTDRVRAWLFGKSA